MHLPLPESGRVICYSYLWYSQSAVGLEDGEKARPCVILRAVEKDGKTRVIVLPITTLQPAQLRDAVEIPAAVARHLGLVDKPMWVICSDANEFDWAGPDLCAVTNKNPATCDYGMLPPALFRSIVNVFMRIVKEHQSGQDTSQAQVVTLKVVKRTG